MIRLKTFPLGGVHPRDMKELSREVEIGNASVPAVSIVALHQHAGNPAECLVHVGDRVREGMLIGKADGRFSAQVHSPVPGKVIEIRETFLPNGVRSKAVVIELEGEFDRLGKAQQARDWRLLKREELLGILAELGVVGMGGSAFPVHLKFSPPPGTPIHHLILNGAESEPYLTSDYRLMLEKAREVVEGLRITAAILEPAKVIIAVEADKSEAVEALSQAASQAGFEAELVALKVKFPQGDEKQLVKAVTGGEVPSGGLPLDLGCVVTNAATQFAVYEAVVYDKPVIERVVTVSGGAVRHPANLKARLGTPFSDLIMECGGFKEIPEKIVAGGPMMGYTVFDLETPLTKSTSGILCLTARETRESRRTACLKCGRCIASCPMGLHPADLFKLIDHSEFARAAAEGLMDCRECGCCGYTCPAHIPLVQGMRVGKRLAPKKSSTN